MSYFYNSLHAYILLHIHCHFQGTTFSNFRHVHPLITRLHILWILISHLGIIHTSTHEKIRILCTRIINKLEWLQSCSLDITPSRSYMTLPCLALFKEELLSPSHNINTWHHRVHIKAMYRGLFILKEDFFTPNHIMLILPTLWNQHGRSHQAHYNIWK